MLIYAMDHHWQGIWGYIYTLTKDPYTTDDLAQEVFVRAFSHWEQFRNESSYKTWLFAIARNVCSDYYRSAFFRRVIPVDTTRFKSMNLSDFTSSEDEAVRSIENHHLWTAIFRLKKAHREVVVLHIREGMTFKEIASILNIREVTARARYRRALQTLRDTLDMEVSNRDV